MTESSFPFITLQEDAGSYVFRNGEVNADLEGQGKRVIGK